MRARAHGSIRTNGACDNGAYILSVALRHLSAPTLARMVRVRCITTRVQATGERAVEASNTPWLLNPKVLFPSIGRGQPTHAPIEVGSLET
eukprot:11096076-Alexandrium_andersonii.AAC.1